MFLVLHLNSRLQPMHRFEIEDALTEILRVITMSGNNGWRNSNVSQWRDRKL